MMAEKGPKTFGGRLRLLRGDMTQAEFAEVVRVKQAMISRYEADKELPSPRAMLRIARFTKRTMEWLLTGEDMLLVNAGEEEEKKLGKKPRAKMTRQELLTIAGAYIKDTRFPEANDFAQMMLELFADRKALQKVLEYYNFMKFESND